METTPLHVPSSYWGEGLGMRMSRLVLGACEMLWPRLAVRVALRLFGTPIPLRWLKRPASRSPEWQVESWPFENASVTVYSLTAGAHAPLALLVHGWGGHAGQMLALAMTLAQQGLRPVLVDLPAHGASAGSTSNLPQFARAIEYVAARLAQQGFVLRVLAAHSLGANAAAFGVSRGLAAQRLVLLAPPASPREYMHYFAHVFGLSETTRAAMQRRVESREAVLMPQFEPESVGPRIRVPTLVVHDRSDRTNRFGDGQAFARAVNGAQLLATQGLGHRKILEDVQVLARVAMFAS
jgi:pimeloyl-ACP methyl ester carboxylesterase